MKHKKTSLPMMLVFFAVVVIVFVTVVQLTETQAVYVENVAELSGVDFSEDLALLSIDCYERYPGALYTPDDFASGQATQPPAQEHPVMEHGFGTYRMVMHLTPGEVYGLSGYTATYAQMLWIDGRLVSQVGVPGDSPQTTVNKTGYFTVYFTAGDVTEIVLQRADFVHVNGGQVYPLYIGWQQNITALANGILLRGVLVVGCSLMAALFFLGIFLFFKRLTHLLWFSLACFSITIYTLILDHKMIMLLFPDMPWEVSHRLEYIMGAGVIFFFFLYVVRMFHLRVWQPVNIFGIATIAIYLAFVLFAPPLVYTAVMPYLRACGVAYCFAALFLLARSMAKDKANRRPEYYLMLCGTLVYIILTLAGIPLHSTGRYGDSNLFRMGLMILIFANTLALAISFTHIEEALDEAWRRQRELNESNRMLDSLSGMKTQFLANISHEMKTPLTVISVNAQVSRTLLKMGGDQGEIIRNLDAITTETRRMARMVGEVLDLSSIQEGRSGFAPVDLHALLEKSAEVYRTLLAKHGNALCLSLPAGLMPVNGSADMLVQVVVNLLANANAHTKDGEISLAATVEDSFVRVSVSDNGTGIPEELLPHVFERRHTGGENGGTGLGLPICKAIIERHGGQIEIDSAGGAGTSVRFTLPLKGEDAQNGA